MPKLRLRSDTGAALVAVTWIVFILAILASGLLATTLTQRETIELDIHETQEKYLAQSAVDLFLARYFYDADERYFRSGVLELLGDTFDIQVNFERGKVNLNRADINHLALVFAANGVPEARALEIASAIVDWRDPDDTPHVLGAEAEAYHQHGLTAGPRNGPFETVGELLSVVGMTRDLFLCVRPLLTVTSLYSGVDASFSSPRMREVLQWAYDNDWQGTSWSDLSTSNDLSSNSGLASTLSGRALTIDVTSQSGAGYRQVIRFKTTASKSYSTLSPLRPLTVWNSQKHCAV